MNRRILFRGRRKGDREWVYGFFTNHCVDHLYIARIEHTTFSEYGEPVKYITVDCETVGQFTGRLDNHNNKIFEGDILRLTSRLFNYVVKVVYDSDECRFIGEKADGTWTEFACLGNIEVIGDIYDNPELLSNEEGA